MAGHVENFDFIFLKAWLTLLQEKGQKRKEEENVHVHREVVKICVLLCCLDL